MAEQSLGDDSPAMFANGKEPMTAVDLLKIDD
jgi:hypothetical protein